MNRTLTIILILLSLLFPAAAQKSPTESQSEKEKAQKELEKLVVDILDSALSDASTLKLARNRAVIFALAGDLYWKFDEKRARDLFRNCEGEIIVAEAESEKEKVDSDDMYAGVFDFSDLRGEILPIVARRDAELALKMLVATRPAKLAAAMNKAADPNTKPDGGMFSFSPERFRVQQEITLEQRFAVLAAEQNPEKAIKLFKDSLEKGLSMSVMPLLEKINQKDPKKASALADDVVRKIADTDLVKKREDLNIAIQMLSFNNLPGRRDPKKKPYRFTDTQIRDIANKLASTFLQSQNSMEVFMAMSNAIAEIEKAVPEKAGLLRQKQADIRKSLPPEMKNFERQSKLWSPTSTPEEIIAELPNLNEFEKTSAYMSLQNKITQIEDETRARKLIEQIPDEKARNQTLERYESERINRAAADGKLDEAKDLIKNLNQKGTQIKKLVALAIQFHRKKTEKDTETAIGLMKDAKQLASEFPEDENELNDLMEIVRGYAVIDPPEAFRIFEPIVEQLNDFVQASAILSKYNKRNQSFRKGELLMPTTGNRWNALLLFRYEAQISLLGKADLGKMNGFADKFQRNDVRTIVKLFTARGFLTEVEKESSENEDDDNMMVIGF